MKQFLVLICFCAVMISCNSNSNTSLTATVDSLNAAVAAKTAALEKNKATAMASVKAIGSGKVEDVLKDVTPDAVDYGDGSSAPIKGRDSISAMIRSFTTAFPDYKGENFLVIGDGNHVAVFADYTGTFKNPMMGMKPTGKSFKVKDVDLFTFNDAGQITEHRNVQSGRTMMEMVGMKMK